MFDTLSDLDVVARTIWAEARGEGREGMQAVANVISNRSTNKAKWDGTTPRSVCLTKWQFSCWLANDPNLPKLLAITDKDPAYRIALELAQKVLTGQLPDITGGADHYHTTNISPSWAKGQKPIKVLGHHAFYKLGEA
jgi:spore germination cell wall hydrolase CwlJ-like protein